MKINNFLCSLCAFAALAAGTCAQAAPVIRLSDGSTTMQVGEPSSSFATADLNLAQDTGVTYVGAVGSHWMLSVSGAGNSPGYSLNASNIGAGGTFLDVELSDTGFSMDSIPALVRFFGEIGGSTQGIVTWSMFVDDSDVLFGHGQLVGTGTNASGTFDSEFSNRAMVDGTFSMTLLVRINHGNAERLSSLDFRGFASPQLVPEPSTILLMGIALFGLALGRRQRR